MLHFPSPPPKGLYVCFTTELWERFSFYGMKYLLVLYLTKYHLFTDEMGLDVLGSYAGLVYALPLIGGMIAGMVLFLFLRRFRMTLVICLSIPLSLLIAITVMHFAGESLNILTLLALVLAIGLIVDDAVVVLENIHRHQSAGEPAADARDPFESASGRHRLRQGPHAESGERESEEARAASQHLGEKLASAAVDRGDVRVGEPAEELGLWRTENLCLDLFATRRPHRILAPAQCQNHDCNSSGLDTS